MTQEIAVEIAAFPVFTPPFGSSWVAERIFLSSAVVIFLLSHLLYLRTKAARGQCRDIAYNMVLSE